MSYKAPSPTAVVDGGTGASTASGARSNLGITDIATQSVTQYDILVGGAANAITSIGPGSAGQIIRSGGAGANPAYSTATYPATTTVSQILYSSSANVVGGITTANNSVVLTDGSGVPSLGTSLANDFTFTKSTGGATTTLTVSETSNTANASAVIVANVAGGTAADAVHQATITAGQAWTWGLDNSDSDAFVIASSATLGTTNVMRVATTGEINFPLQTAFLAYNSVTDGNVTGDGTHYTVIFDSEIFDQNSDYDNSTGVMTAPVTGRYQLSLGINLSNLSASFTGGYASFIASNRNFDLCQINVGAARNAGNNYCFTLSMLVDMDAADVVHCEVLASGGTKVVGVLGGNVNTGFSGYLAC